MDVSLSVVRPWTFLGLTVILGGTLVWLLIRGNLKSILPALLGFSVCAYFSYADNFASFSLSSTGGFEARAKTVVAEAKDATNELKKIAVAAATAIVTINGNSAGNSSVPMLPSATMRDANKARIIDLLKSMGISGSEIGQVEHADDAGVIAAYESAILMHTLKAAAWQFPNVPQELLSDDYRLDPDKALSFIDSHKINDPETVQLLRDYQYFLKNDKQRRPEAWAARDTWYQKPK